MYLSYRTPLLVFLPPPFPLPHTPEKEIIFLLPCFSWCMSHIRVRQCKKAAWFFLLFPRFLGKCGIYRITTLGTKSFWIMLTFGGNVLRPPKFAMGSINCPMSNPTPPQLESQLRFEPRVARIWAGFGLMYVHRKGGLLILRSLLPSSSSSFPWLYGKKEREKKGEGLLSRPPCAKKEGGGKRKAAHVDFLPKKYVAFLI